MKRIIAFLIASIIFLPLSLNADVPNKKERRKARKEIRKQERAIKDSLLMLMEEADSVNVGYGYTKKSRNNSSVSRLKVQKNDVTSYTNIADYIQGRVPGVMVQKNGDSYRYIVRGINSINGPTDPLLMIDGVEVDNFDSLIPSQVESVEVIKDASASIYGMRGACGVIMITTKKQY